MSRRRRWLFRGILLLLVIAVLELTSWIALTFLNQRYPMDPLASLQPALVEQFLKRSYDADLGWVPRERDELNSLGARSQREYEDVSSTISVYGDSWTWCPGVPVDESWPYLLEQKSGVGVLNFGVSGYGTDQALLRLEKTYSQAPSKTVVLCILPENLGRCLNICKCFYQAHGVPSKPWFTVEQGELVTHNPFDSPDKVRHLLLADHEQFIQLAEQYDYWYRQETIFGRPWSITFPFTVQLAARTGYLWGKLRIGLTDESSYAPLYADPQTFAVMQAIVRRFRQFATDHGARPIVLVFPTIRDVRRNLAGQSCVYRPLVDFLQTEGLAHLDFLSDFSKQNDFASLYLNRRDHISLAGAEVISDVLLNFLSQQQTASTIP